MLLGDILGQARRAAGAFETWLTRVEPELADETAAAASAAGLSIGNYARMAVSDFSRLASEEDWASLVSAMRDSGDPGITCLTAMVGWRLSARTCAVHSHHSGAGHV